MSAEYALNYRSLAGIMYNIEFSSLSYTRKENEVGDMTVQVPASYGVDFFEPDGQFYVYRSVNGNVSDLDGETFWFVKTIKFTIDSSGQESLEVGAVDALDLMRRRIIAYDGDTSYTNKSGICDDILKDIVTENFGISTFDAARNLSAYLLIQADASAGAIVEATFQYENVYDSLIKLCDASRQAGVRVIFDVVCIDDSRLEFRTYANYRGYDHSSDSALPVIVGYDFGTLSDIEIVKDYGEEINVIYAGGKGEGEARNVEMVMDATRVAMSPFNRKEGYLNSNNTVTVAGLQSEGNAALSQGRPRLIFSGRMIDAPGATYGIDFTFGDLVAAQFMGQMLDCRVDTISITVDSSGEQLDIRLRGEIYL